MSSFSDQMVGDVATALGLSAGTGEGDIQTTDVLRTLNRVYQYEIPTQIAGWSQKGSAQVSFSAGDSVIGRTTTSLSTTGLAGRFKKLIQPVLVDDNPIYFTTEPALFWALYQYSDATRQTPSGCLYWGNELTLRPIADKAYTITLFGVEFRQTKIEALTGPEELLDVLEYDAIVNLAAAKLAVREGMEDVLKRCSAEGARQLNIVAARAFANSGRSRRARRRNF